MKRTHTWDRGGVRSPALVCPCGCDRWVTFREIEVAGKTVFTVLIDRCEDCGRSADDALARINFPLWHGGVQ